MAKGKRNTANQTMSLAREQTLKKKMLVELAVQNQALTRKDQIGRAHV